MKITLVKYAFIELESGETFRVSQQSGGPLVERYSRADDFLVYAEHKNPALYRQLVEAGTNALSK